MPRRVVPLVSGGYYHVYNRGNNYQPIFFDRENRRFFLAQLRRYVAGPCAELLAYVLMPNHYHLLLKMIGETFSSGMQKFAISYTKAINKRYGRVGALFQGAYQAILVEDDAHLLHLARYIHLNPVRAGLAKKPEDWEFSSYRETIGLRPGTLPNPDMILSFFASAGAAVETRQQRYQQFVADWGEGDSD
jgi:putative transposase